MDPEISEGQFRYDIVYEGTDVQLLGYVDSDFVGDVESRRNTTDYIFSLKSGALSWVSRL